MENDMEPWVVQGYIGISGTWAELAFGEATIADRYSRQPSCSFCLDGISIRKPCVETPLKSAPYWDAWKGSQDNLKRCN